MPDQHLQESGSVGDEIRFGYDLHVPWRWLGVMCVRLTPYNSETSVYWIGRASKFSALLDVLTEAALSRSGK